MKKLCLLTVVLITIISFKPVETLSVCHVSGGVPQKVFEAVILGDQSGDTIGWSITILSIVKGVKAEADFGISKLDHDIIRQNLIARAIDSVSIYDLCSEKGEWRQTKVDRFYKGVRL